METLAIGAANSIYLIAAVMLGCGVLLLWGVGFSGFRKTKRTGQIVATVILALATVGVGLIWIMFAVVGAGVQLEHDMRHGKAEFGLPMVVYYSPLYVIGLWIVNLIVFLRDMFTRKNREIST
jgi:hypothetical protein